MKGLGGLLLAPAVWLTGFQLIYSLTPVACHHPEWSFVLHVIPPLTLLGTASSFWMAWSNWRAAGAEWPDESATVTSRDRFMAVLGMLFSAYLSLLVITQWFPVFLLNPCQR
jgi:hypothetical protein